MSANTNELSDEQVFRLKHTTGFMRVTQVEDESGHIRHPGSATLPRNQSTQPELDASFSNPFDTSSLMGELGKKIRI